MPDRIIIHGSNIRNELEHIFQIPPYKVIIQKHGAKDPENGNKVDYDIRLITYDIKNKIRSYDKRFLFIGDMHYNKGIDRLIKVWAEIGDASCLLIIAGQKVGRYRELEGLEALIRRTDNILYIDYFIEDNLLNFFLSSVDCVLLPYRHASMSGVIFSAAQFRKTILCTDVGALSEYVVNGETGFVVRNADESLKNALSELIYTVSREELQKMGEANFQYIDREYSWDKIARDLSVECYGGASPMGGERNAGIDTGRRFGNTIKKGSQ